MTRRSLRLALRAAFGVRDSVVPTQAGLRRNDDDAVAPAQAGAHLGV